MDSLVALQTQSGSAESGAGGTLELRCCDISRECSLASLIGCQQRPLCNRARLHKTPVTVTGIRTCTRNLSELY